MMKKVWMAAALGLTLAACGGGDTKDASDSKSANAAVTNEKSSADDPSKNPDYQKGLALVAQNDCLTCHKINEASTGPAYADIAAKYAGADDDQIKKLANTIIKGGSGNWGQVPMTPHPTLSEADAVQMVKYVLLLKKS